MHACINVWAFVQMHVYMEICVYVYIYLRVHVHVCVCVCVHIDTCVDEGVNMHICMYVEPIDLEFHSLGTIHLTF